MPINGLKSRGMKLVTWQRTQLKRQKQMLNLRWKIWLTMLFPSDLMDCQQRV